MNIESPYITPDWPLADKVVAGTTLTHHVVAQKGFNLAQHVDDTLAHVRANRAQLMAHLGDEVTPMWLSQTHSNRVVKAREYQFPIVGDAAISDHAQWLPVVLTADCLPIILADGNARYVAAIHAGWPGLYKSIIAYTIANMPCQSSELYAWIGPAISQENYEVDEAFYQRFVGMDADYSAFFQSNRPQHYKADLIGIAREQLRRCGVRETHIFASHLCSYDDERFFSHRRDGLQSGRMATFILPKHRAC